MGKILLLTLNEQEETAIDKIIAAIADCISLKAVQTIPVPASGMSFSGLEIIQSRQQVLQEYLKPFGTWKAILAIQALST